MITMQEAIDGCRKIHGISGEFWIAKDGNGRANAYTGTVRILKEYGEWRTRNGGYYIINNPIDELKDIDWQQSLVKVNADDMLEFVNKEKTVADLKVGDSCFSVITGWGTIKSINDDLVLVNDWWYDRNGKTEDCDYQLLFTSATQALEYAKKNWK